MLILMSIFISIQLTQTPQENKKRADQIYIAAYKELEQENYQQASDKFSDFLKLRSNYINALFYKAKAEAALGNLDKSFLLLNQIVTTGIILNPANFEDPDFKKIDPIKINRLKKKLNENSEAIGSAEVYLQLEERDLITESIAIDFRSGDSYVSSVRKRKIIQIDKDGKTSEFSQKEDGLWAVFSLKISADGRFLWASSSATKEMMHTDTVFINKTALFCYDLKSKKMLRKYSLPADGKQHIWGDFIISKNGEIYISDSIDNTIYVLKPASGKFQKYFESNYFSSLQGLAFNQDQSTLFVADYSDGIYKIDLSTKQVWKINSPDSIALRGLDGLYFYNNTLIASQNGFRPNRIIQLNLNRDETEFTGYRSLLANNPIVNDPTLGQLSDSEFYFIANSQWSMVKSDGSVKSSDQLEKPTILKVGIE